VKKPKVLFAIHNPQDIPIAPIGIIITTMIARRDELR
jgi:hypothetical protein